MSTLVYRDGVIVAESQITSGNTIVPGSAKKIHRLGGGAIYGYVGSLELGALMKELIEQGADEYPELADQNYEGLILGKNGEKLFYEGRGWYPLDLPYIAMGSGRDYAYGAMALGASAAQALKAAMTLDTGSSGKVVKLKWKHYKGGFSSVEEVWTNGPGKETG